VDATIARLRNSLTVVRLGYLLAEALPWRARLRAGRDAWRMPPLDRLDPPLISNSRRVGLAVLRGYLVLACALVVVRIVELALAH
jgi:hypothetical protein